MDLEREITNNDCSETFHQEYSAATGISLSPRVADLPDQISTGSLQSVPKTDLHIQPDVPQSPIFFPQAARNTNNETLSLQSQPTTPDSDLEMTVPIPLNEKKDFPPDGASLRQLPSTAACSEEPFTQVERTPYVNGQTHDPSLPRPKRKASPSTFCDSTFPNGVSTGNTENDYSSIPEIASTEINAEKCESRITKIRVGSEDHDSAENNGDEISRSRQSKPASPKHDTSSRVSEEDMNLRTKNVDIATPRILFITPDIQTPHDRSENTSSPPSEDNDLKRKARDSPLLSPNVAKRRKKFKIPKSFDFTDDVEIRQDPTIGARRHRQHFFASRRSSENSTPRVTPTLPSIPDTEFRPDTYKSTEVDKMPQDGGLVSPGTGSNDPSPASQNEGVALNHLEDQFMEIDSNAATSTDLDGLGTVVYHSKHARSDERERLPDEQRTCNGGPDIQDANTVEKALNKETLPPTLTQGIDLLHPSMEPLVPQTQDAEVEIGVQPHVCTDRIQPNLSFPQTKQSVHSEVDQISSAPPAFNSDNSYLEYNRSLSPNACEQLVKEHREGSVGLVAEAEKGDVIQGGDRDIIMYESQWNGDNLSIQPTVAQARQDNPRQSEKVSWMVEHESDATTADPSISQPNDDIEIIPRSSIPENHILNVNSDMLDPTDCTKVDRLPNLTSTNTQYDQIEGPDGNTPLPNSILQQDVPTLAGNLTRHSDIIADNISISVPMINEVHTKEQGPTVRTTEVQPAQQVSASQSKFDAFKKAYPDYSGDIKHFVAVCRKLKTLVDEDRMEQRPFWDDFIVRNKIDYAQYLRACAEEAEDPMSYERFYRTEIGEPRYNHDIVNLGNLNEILSLDMRQPDVESGYSNPSKENTSSVAPVKPKTTSRLERSDHVIQEPREAPIIIDLTEDDPIIESEKASKQATVSSPINTPRKIPRSFPWNEHDRDRDLFGNQSSPRKPEDALRQEQPHTSLYGAQTPKCSPTRSHMSSEYTSLDTNPIASKRPRANVGSHISRSSTLGIKQGGRQNGKAKDDEDMKAFWGLSALDVMGPKYSDQIGQGQMAVMKEISTIIDLEEARHLIKKAMRARGKRQSGDTAAKMTMDDLLCVKDVITSKDYITKNNAHRRTNSPIRDSPNRNTSDPLSLPQADTQTEIRHEGDRRDEWWRDPNSPFNSFARAYLSIRPGNGNSYAKKSEPVDVEHATTGAERRNIRPHLNEIDIMSWRL